MVINENLLHIEVMRDIVNTANCNLMDLLEEYQYLDMHSYTYTEYEMHLDFVNALIFGIEKTAKVRQE
jgi:hypothetical protein|nr:MAG TPA: hypothetical protein [Caudoviricetes sp.]